MSPIRKKVYRIVAAYLLLNMTAELVAPIAAHALTNGPGQPEFQSFTPAGSTEMVNLFTGDFSYNIPLMTVPGPNGGYPINLGYNAGIGMEQEASWCGLGWNINAGAINRSVRGLPDDFKGDEVIKRLHFRPSNSMVLNFGTSIASTELKKEILGFDQLQASGGVQVYYNNYRGIGFQFAMNFALSSAEQNSSPYSAPLKINLTNSSDGIGVNVRYSVLDQTSVFDAKQNKGIGVSATWGSREGISSLQFSYDKESSNPFIGSANGLGVSFVSSGFVPTSSPEMEGFIANTGIAIGPESGLSWNGEKTTSILASYNRTWAKFTTQTYKSYGYMYSESSPIMSQEKVLGDINREKDNPPTRQSKTLGVPIATYDSYSVSGQGMGGSFRPYRSDIGIYTDPLVTSEIYGGSASAEFGTTDAAGFAKLGFDGSYIESKSSSGMWHNYWLASTLDEGWDAISNYDFYIPASNEKSYEPFYFKMAGELTSAPTTQLNFCGNTTAVRLTLREIFEDGVNISPRPKIDSDILRNNPGSSSYDLNTADGHRAAREKVVTRNGNRTNGDMQRFTASVPENIYSTKNLFDALGGSATPTACAYTTGEDHHIGEFTETGADGSRYVYGIPVYNKLTKEVMFAKESYSAYNTTFLAPYVATEATEQNNEANTDQLFSSIETPPYASSYLLTGVYSPDYVDVSGDGPSEDDLGYYTKFNYVLINDDFKWRAPYGGAFMDAGHLSNVNDDKLSYQYGEKEIYLLHSIETKTHVACFFLGSDGRKDAHAATTEAETVVAPGSIASTDELYAVDSILLFSKNDPDYGSPDATPIKAVHFTYDYSLCDGVYNNENSGSSTGKLTLKEVYFTYKNNRKGKLSPYKFTYAYDPNYDPLGNDRWGSYKPQTLVSNYRNNENPYTDQRNRANADQYAAAWALSQIELPSGSIVNIEYEADDYAYVQNKRAMQMCRVIGFADESYTDPQLYHVQEKLNKKRTLVYFELNEAIPFSASASEKSEAVRDYVEGIQEMYFKLFLSLKPPYGTTGDDLYDYVDGFCRIKDETGTYGVVDDNTADHLYGYLTVELVDRDDYPATPGVTEVNPFEKAAWQYMYLERPDLFANPDIASGTMSNFVAATSVITAIGELARAVAPYISANVRGWGNKLDINITTHECAMRPSYIRLNAPEGKKVGGGHRVKQIQISDDWNDISSSAGAESTYGQSYTYVLTDGQSSGVASYEPMIGGEENAMCMPIRYNSENLVKKDGAFYVMEPIGESYYPAPVVGYSRVGVSSIISDPDVGQTVTKSRTGKTEYEFYTAKDYPVYTDRTDLQKTWFPVPVLIPFVGSITYNTRGFSQGFVVELNDMHGKLKAVSTYPSYADLTSSSSIPTRRVFYKYNGGYQADKANRLSSTVDVLTSDGIYDQANLGETYDLFFDLRQYSNRTQEFGGQLNLTYVTLPLGLGGVVPTFLPTINISKSLYRSSAAMKVIYRTGILTEVETRDDGAKSTARNLMFDAETGAPLLTVVENEFERPVYTYNFAAHWAYEGMQGAYKNQGARFNGLTTDGTTGEITVTDAESYFFAGDEVMFIPSSGAGTMLWVTEINGNDVTLVDADGDPLLGQTGEFIIHRSGRRNLQSVSNGVIVSLNNPVTERSFPLFTDMSGITSLQENTNYSFEDCATGNTITYKVFLSGLPTNRLHIETVGGEACRSSIQFGSDFSLSNIAQLARTTFILHGNQVELQIDSDNNPATPPDIVYGTWLDPNRCFNLCMDNVLHASAVRFAEDWSAVGEAADDHLKEINFTDVGVTATDNEYKYGLRGVWRTHSNYLYQVDRNQTTGSASKTDISKDGTYNNFVLYNWEIAAQDNTQWAFVSAVTRYSPYGYALETRDALGIYSSVMYGYDNTKQTAAAANSQYFEMGYDGFEDYAGSYTGHGHLLFSDLNPSEPSNLATLYSHSGKYSYDVQYGGGARCTVVCNGTYDPTQQYFECQPNQEYFFSVWAKADHGSTPTVTINRGTGPDMVFTAEESTSAIEGWKKIDCRFTAPASGNTLTITLSAEVAGNALFDDIRIQPFKSAMTSYVYDPQTHWLLAELDNRNYATFYNYDEEGALVQVKQETEKGIFTVQTSRGNIVR